ncbi:phage tail length tape-measure protein [Vibrio variabilis]|uniref:Phage tail length tape-measure protein n=1 Tax=Vibrio variabilis TaxID=990271 RepID=A0ABQ0JGB1_9VIBR|nr:phage tail length tape-measure protein [Vibrio variabilis]
MKITGTKEFKQQVLDVAVSKDLNIVFVDKAMEAEFIRRKEELKQAATVKASTSTEPQPTVAIEENALVKSNVESLSSVDDVASAAEEVMPESPRVQPVTLVAHGKAPYQHDKDNSNSYFVELSNGETKWGVGLKDAIEKSGAQIGDEVAVSKSGQKEVSVPVQETDYAGNKLPPEWIDTKRNEWVVDILSPAVSTTQAPESQGSDVVTNADIKALRREREWSQKHLAEALEVSVSTISKWERGKAVPLGENLAKLNQLLGPSSKTNKFHIDYQWDASVGKLSVTVNGGKPELVDRTVLERISEK